MSAIAYLAGLGSGYLDERDRQASVARQAKLDQIALDRASRDQTTFDQQQQDRTDLRAAAAPVPVTESQLPGPTEDGSPMPTTYNVGASRFASQGVAQQAAVGQQQQNVAAAANQIDPLGAGKRTMAALEVTAAQRDAANKNWDDDLSQAANKGVQGVIDFTNASGASPQQSKFVLGPDGKTGEVHLIAPDGTDRPTGQVFTNDAAGARNMALFLSKNTPLPAKMAHYQAEAESARKAKVDDADVLEKTARAGYYDAQAKASGNKPDDDPFAKMPEAAKIQLQGIQKQAETIDAAVTKAMADGTWDENSPNAKSLRSQRAALGLRANAMVQQYTKAAPGADPLSLRGGTTTTRAPTADEKVAQDMQATGVKDATIDIGGKTRVVGKGATPPTPAARAVQGVQTDDIPPPPPQMRQIGLSLQPNPAYAAWDQQYGEAWRAQQGQQGASADAAALAARASYNPYAQNRVR